MHKFISKKSLIKTVKSYFGTHDYSLSITQIGVELMVEVRYKDFEPKKKVRRTIEDFGENVTVVLIERTFSDKVMFDTLMSLTPNDCQLFVKLDGQYIPTCPAVAAEDYLLNRTIK